MDNKNNSWDRNSWNRNSWDRNSWDRNSGNRNSWDRNSGNRNSWDRNSWYRNSWDRNSGNRNSGNRNSGNRNSWDLNTNEPNVRIFNKDSWKKRYDIIYPNYFYFDYNHVELEWDENKQKPIKTQNEEYLKYRWKKSFNKADKEDVAKTLELPNFDYNLFEEISWITKDMIDEKLSRNKIEFDWKEFVNKEKLIEYIKNM